MAGSSGRSVGQSQQPFALKSVNLPYPGTYSYYPGCKELHFPTDLAYFSGRINLTRRSCGKMTFSLITWRGLLNENTGSSGGIKRTRRGAERVPRLPCLTNRLGSRPNRHRGYPAPAPPDPTFKIPWWGYAVKGAERVPHLPCLPNRLGSLPNRRRGYTRPPSHHRTTDPPFHDGVLWAKAFRADCCLLSAY